MRILRSLAGVAAIAFSLCGCDPSKLVAGVTSLTPAQDAMLVCLAATAGETINARFDTAGNALCTLSTGAAVVVSK